jgi:hypothetical protein
MGTAVSRCGEIEPKWVDKLVERKNRELLDNYFENFPKKVAKSCRLARLDAG